MLISVHRILLAPFALHCNIVSSVDVG